MNNLKIIDFDKAKNEIVREIAESTDFHNVVRNICRKNGFNNDFSIIEDIKQEVIEKMLKKDSEQMYDWYCDNHKRPFAIAYGIARKQFLKHPSLIGYNKHSFGEYISFAGNLKNKDAVEVNINKSEIPTWQDTGDAEDFTDTEEPEHVIYYLISFLQDDEKDLILFELDKTQTKGKHKKEYKEKRAVIFEKLRQIAKEKNIDFD